MTVAIPDSKQSARNTFTVLFRDRRAGFCFQFGFVFYYLAYLFLNLILFSVVLRRKHWERLFYRAFQNEKNKWKRVPLI